MKSILLFVFVLLFNLLQAQTNNIPLEDRTRPDSSKTDRLYLSIHNFNYLRNYEFFNDFQDGYTLFGTHLEPKLIYYAHPRLALTAGIHVRKDFGDEGIYKTTPLFSLKYQWKNTALITGALEGNIHHRYIEPLFDLERKITEPVEYGTQLVVQNPGLFLDAWINWKKMIYKPSAEQEQILGGLSSDIRLYESEKWKLSLPLQLLAFHEGGQIDTVSKPLQTLLNTAAGFKISMQTRGFVKNVHTENYVTFFKELSPEKLLAFSNGSGLFLNAGLDTHWGNISTSYWKGRGFIAKQGMPVYQSVSKKINKEDYTKKNRELLFLRYAYQKKLIPNLYLDFRVEPVFFLDGGSSNTVDFYHSMFLVYRQEFLIGKSR